MSKKKTTKKVTKKSSTKKPEAKVEADPMPLTKPENVGIGEGEKRNRAWIKGRARKHPLQRQS